MIKVNVRLSPKSNNQTDNVAITAYNKVANDLNGRMSKDLSKYSCENHTTKDSVVTIISTKDGIKFHKDFCCDKFSNSIELKL